MVLKGNKVNGLIYKTIQGVNSDDTSLNYIQIAS
jgi:hypothetical protein